MVQELTSSCVDSNNSSRVSNLSTARPETRLNASFGFSGIILSRIWQHPVYNEVSDGLCASVHELLCGDEEYTQIEAVRGCATLQLSLVLGRCS